MLRKAADYVVVGAGSAGCVLAHRLSAAGASVLLLESGGPGGELDPNRPSLFSRMPTALALPMHFEGFNWGYLAEPEPSLDGKRVTCPRGKGLGGSSAINGMVYVRGHDRDYDAWNKGFGGKGGWGAADVLPYFKRMEGVCVNANAGDANDILPGRRGTDGPLQVSHGVNALGTPLYDAFVKAGDEAGYGSIYDYNGCRQEGLSKMPMTVFHSGPNAGQRASVRAAYLEPALAQRPNLLTVITEAHARRIVWSDDRTSKPRADAVEYSLPDGTIGTATANKEVIVSAGAIASPMLLHLSGVGPPDMLSSLGIDVVHALRGVGSNLMDHLEVYQSYEVKQPVSLAPHLSLVGKGTLGARWLAMSDGLGATNHFETGGFVRSRPGVESPDVQLHFLPIGMSYDGVTLAPTKTGHSMQMHVGYNKSPSRGLVAPITKLQVAGTAPPVEPSIRFNYMSTDEDWRGFRAAIRIAREIVAQPAFAELCGDEISPGAKAQTDNELDEYLKEHLESAYHPCGTCKLGPSSDDSAVVDADGKVHGIDRLRVVDASIFPELPNGNLNAPTIMTAEKMADHILGLRLDPDHDQANATWIDPHWQTRQREKEPLVKTWDRVF